jgi:hypothetical protein
MNARHTRRAGEYGTIGPPIFKRGVVGAFHKMSQRHMPLYVAEFQFRYSNRVNADIFGAEIKGCWVCERL